MPIAGGVYASRQHFRLIHSIKIFFQEKRTHGVHVASRPFGYFPFQSSLLCIGTQLSVVLWSPLKGYKPLVLKKAHGQSETQRIFPVCVTVFSETHFAAHPNNAGPQTLKIGGALFLTSWNLWRKPPSLHVKRLSLVWELFTSQNLFHSLQQTLKILLLYYIE